MQSIAYVWSSYVRTAFDFVSRKSDQKPAYQTGEILRAYNSKDGLICVNNEQPDGRCDDYEVRMCCPGKNNFKNWYIASSIY